MGGVARLPPFYLINTSMATKPDSEFLKDKSRPSNHNYLAINYFRVDIGRAPTASYFAQEANIPSITNSELLQMTTLSTQIPLPGNLYTFMPLNIKFLLDENLRGWQEIYDWITSISNLKSTANTVKQADKFSDINVIVTNSAYKHRFQFTFRHAFPVALSEVPLAITATDTTPLTAMATFKYAFYEFKTLTSS